MRGLVPCRKNRRQLGGGNVAGSYNDATVPGTPAWQEPQA